MARHFAVRAAPLVVLAIAGVVLIATDHHDTTIQIVGGAMEAIAGILLLSLVFYEVGRSEDRARAAEERERRT